MKKLLELAPKRLLFFLRYIQYKYCEIKYRKIRNNKDNGIYYFIPEVPGHFMHAAPLYRLVGGTVITVSKKNKQEIAKKYHVKCIAIDDVVVSDVKNFDATAIAKTFKYLNKHAKVVIFYDLMDLKGQLTSPSIFLHHGVSLGKAELFWSDKRRIEYVKQLDYISSVDQLSHEIMIRDGVPKDKMLNLTIARTTEIIQRAVLFRTRAARVVCKKLNIKRGHKVIVYMTSYWSQNSLEDTGLNLAKYINDEYILIFWPHPQTDRKYLKKYEEIAKERGNIIIGQKLMDLDIMDLYVVSNLFIADSPTSVVSDMILAQKPIVFAYGDGENATIPGSPEPLENVISSSLRLDYSASRYKTVVNNIIDRALKAGFDRKAYWHFINSTFYNTTGVAAVRTAQYVVDIMRNGKIMDKK